MRRHRSASRVLDGGQSWRVATALVVQDGGVGGTVSNLILLAVALILCLPLWGATATLSTLLLVGVGLNVAAVFGGADHGAGNSGATLPLLASLPMLAFAVLPDQQWRGVVGARRGSWAFRTHDDAPAPVYCPGACRGGRNMNGDTRSIICW